MSKYLYERFLDNHAIYHVAIAYWTRKIKKIFDPKLGSIKYLNDRYNNSKLFYDGNPIYNVAYPCKNKAVRIIQLSPNDYDEYYTSWENLVESSHFAGTEKVIALTLTPKNRNLALDELNKWLNG